MFSSRQIVCLVSCLLLCGTLSATVHAQDRLAGDAMIEKYLAAEADKLAKKFMDGARTLDEWTAKRPQLYREYMDTLGLWPVPAKTPLNAIVTRQHEAHGVIVENLHFQSKPGLYVTANFYRPKSSPSGKLPTILYVCGHASRGRDGNKSAYQNHGFWFANNGYNCLILDTLQLGEIAGIHHGTYGLRGGKGEAPTRMWWHSAGYTPAGVECWNGVRAIDYLLTRPEVDPDKIGVTGISGGGAATFWVAAADERVKVAVPVSGMSDLESYVKNKVVNGHCDCMFLYNTYQWDWTTIAAMIAPRPMLFANSDNDGMFPMDGNRRIIAKLRDCYKMHGKPELVEEYVSVGGHAYRPDLRIAIFTFINKHLKGDTTSAVEDSAKYTELPGKELRAFPTDADLPKDALNAKIDETFVPKAMVKLPQPGRFAEWKIGMIAELRARVFRPLPNEIPAAKLLETNFVSFIGPEPGVVALTNYWDFREIGDNPLMFRLLYVPDEVANDWLVQSPVATKRLKDVFAKGGFKLWARGTPLPENDSLTSPLNWTRKSPPNYLERSHALLGRTVDQGRVRDVIATTKLWEKEVHAHPKAPKETWTLTGHARGGVIAAYAALLEPSIKEVIVYDPPKSHMDGPHLPGILRVLDIPEALGLLAPTPLTIIGGQDAAFDRTAEIYRLAGAADKLTRK